MEGSYPPPSDSNPTAASGASKFLTNLPNRGLLSSVIPSANPGGVRVYICDHDTSPPENQLIKTNQMNILIRSLVLEKQKGESSSKGIVITGGSRKRAPARALDGRTSSKRAMTSTENSSRQEGSKLHASDKDFSSLKMDELRALLREKGLSIRGRKGELISRLRSASG